MSVAMSDERRAALRGTALAVQIIAALFFVGDVVIDLFLDPLGPEFFLEATVSLALLLGVLFGAAEMRRLLQRSARSEAALKVAQGALAELVAERFDAWGLTPAEAEVALLALKGFDVAEIARLRGKAAGTVRAQLARVYSKAGVSSRAELLSVFIDDLLDVPEAGTTLRDPVPE